MLLTISSACLCFHQHFSGEKLHLPSRNFLHTATVSSCLLFLFTTIITHKLISLHSTLNGMLEINVFIELLFTRSLKVTLITIEFKLLSYTHMDYSSTCFPIQTLLFVRKSHLLQFITCSLLFLFVKISKHSCAWSKCFFKDSVLSALNSHFVHF